MHNYEVLEEIKSGRSILDIPLRVTFYARVSTGSDNQINSLDNQISFFENMIKNNHNWTFISGYIDEGISGSTVKGRVNFMKMIDDAKKKTFDLIITKEVSRFSRNLLDSIKYTGILKECGVGVFFYSNGINTFDPNSEFILNMMGSVAQEEVKRLSERIKFGHHNAIMKGRILGSSNILGYKKNKCTLEIIEAEAKFIKQVFKLYASNKYGLNKLSDILYEKGYKNTKGNKYDKTTLRRIIENPKYKGYYRGKTTMSFDYKSKKRKYLPKEEWIIYEDANIPKIVSIPLWNKANKILKSRQT